ncbi:hypothetical protein SUDANB1_07136 [Streptomyces sp. enrichment culture]|uniref:hypothetical protein n=1 Tax=Streptomyces sp. enrichment culture TaxID=1795815 RepID=UPI003F562E85
MIDQPRGPGDWARHYADQRETQAAVDLRAELAGHYQRAVDAAVAAEQRAKQAEAIVARVRAARDRIAQAPGWVDAIFCLDVLEEALGYNQPAPYAGPSIREAADNDRRWPLEKEGE